MEENNLENLKLRQTEIAAKREARRKKILENSNNRLEKIAGRQLNEDTIAKGVDIPKTDVIYDDPEIEREVYEQSVPNGLHFSTLPNTVEFPQNDIFQLLNDLRENQPNGNPFLRPNAEQYQQSTRPTPSIVNRVLATKIHIFILSVVIYLLFATGNQNYSINNVFLYLLLWEFAEVFVLKTYMVKQNNLVSILFLLGGISQNYTTFLLKLVETINKILKDVAIFIFFFVLSHLIYEKCYNGNDFDSIIGKQDILFERI